MQLGETETGNVFITDGNPTTRSKVHNLHLVEATGNINLTISHHQSMTNIMVTRQLRDMTQVSDRSVAAGILQTSTSITKQPSNDKDNKPEQRLAVKDVLVINM